MKLLQLNKNGEEQREYGQPRCEIYQILCIYKTALAMHLKGKKCKAKLHELELGSKTGGENGMMVLWSEMCDIPCMNEDYF